jgi:hypothetical protein
MISGLLTLPDEPPFSSRDEALQQLRFALRHGVSDSILECLAQLGTQRQLRDLMLSILDAPITRSQSGSSRVSWVKWTLRPGKEIPIRIGLPSGA